MPGQPLRPPVRPPAAPGRSIRVEYLDFQNVGEHREFRLRVHGPDGTSDFRFGIPLAAFVTGRLRLQDGPDVCYQKVLRAVAAGEAAGPDVIMIDDAELALYREAHTHVPKHKSWSPAPPPATPPPTTAS